MYNRAQALLCIIHVVTVIIITQDEETDSCAVENDRSLLLRTTNTSYTAGGTCTVHV